MTWSQVIGSQKDKVKIIIARFLKLLDKDVEPPLRYCVNFMGTVWHIYENPLEIMLTVRLLNQ
jgi:hypothetical protein